MEIELLQDFIAVLVTCKFVFVLEFYAPVNNEVM